MRLDAVTGTWRERYRAQDADSQLAATLLNRCLKRLSNLLIPIQSTVKGVYGHDPYGFTAQLSAIPCLYDVAAWLDASHGSEASRLLETHLRRERNRVADAVDDAGEVVRSTLSQLGE